MLTIIITAFITFVLTLWFSMLANRYALQRVQESEQEIATLRTMLDDNKDWANHLHSTLVRHGININDEPVTRKS